MFDYISVRKCNGWWECAVGIGKFFVTMCAAGAVLNSIAKEFHLIDKDFFWSKKF